VKYFVGLDVHWKFTVICILDRNGRIVKRTRVVGRWSAVVEKVRELKGRIHVCYEASLGYGYLYDRLREVADRVVVAHPGSLRLIFRCKRKNDRVDAEKLAKLLYLNEVPPVHVPNANVREWRQLIEYRGRLIAKRTRAKNSLRAVLRSQGIQAPRGLWSKRGLTWLAEVELPAFYGVRRSFLLEEMQLLNGQLREVEKVLAEYAQHHPAVQLLRTIPGVGLRTAEAVVAYLDDPHRFRRNKSVGCYFGLVPTQDQSAKTNRLGHITKEGPAAVRRLLCEATWQAIRRSPMVNRYFNRIQRDDKQRKKIALVATAHYLVRVMHAMLRDGEPWQETLAA
jgi:transposase